MLSRHREEFVGCEKESERKYFFFFISAAWWGREKLGRAGRACAGGRRGDARASRGRLVQLAQRGIIENVPTLLGLVRVGRVRVKFRRRARSDEEARSPTTVERRYDERPRTRARTRGRRVGVGKSSGQMETLQPRCVTASREGSLQKINPSLSQRRRSEFGQVDAFNFFFFLHLLLGTDFCVLLLFK